MGNFGGTVFTEHVHLKYAIGLRAPRLTPPYPRVIHHDIIINGICVAYPLALGHFLHEALPRVIVMARLYPHAPILLAVDDKIREVLSLLPWIDSARIIEWLVEGVASRGFACLRHNFLLDLQEQQRLVELAPCTHSGALCGGAVSQQPVTQSHGRVNVFPRRSHEAGAS